MKTIAPKPSNFDELSRAWNNPEAYAREVARYHAEPAQTKVDAVDYSQPRHAPEGTR